MVAVNGEQVIPVEKIYIEHNTLKGFMISITAAYTYIYANSFTVDPCCPIIVDNGYKNAYHLLPAK